MTHSAILKAAAVVAAIFGVVMLLAPQQLATLYGVPPLNSTGMYNTQLYGAFLLGLAASNWGMSLMSEDAVRPVIVGNLIATGLALIVVVVRQFQADATQAGWLNVAIFLVFTAAFGYELFARLGGVHMHRPAH